MSRSISLALLFVYALGALVMPSPSFAEDKKAKKKPVPLQMATDEEAAEALKTFKVEYKAKGLAKDDKISQRLYAIEQLIKIQHPDVVDALAKVSRSSDGDLRMLALIYLGEQRLLPHEAGKAILASMKKNRKDTVLVMTGLQAIGSLRYLGAHKEIARLLKHSDFVVKKSAITAVGATRDVRLLGDVLKLLGIKTDTEPGKTKDSGKTESDKKDGGKETTEEGYSWEGAEATVDHGHADNTQENAEAKAKAEAQIAANKAAAEASKSGSGASDGAGGASGATGGLGGGTGGGRGASSRSTDELIPSILWTLKKLTGQQFDHPRTIKKWLEANGSAVQRQMTDLDAREKAQKKKS